MADVVIVGAGIVGASIAYHVAKRGCAVTLIDRGVPASGVTGGSFAWIGGASGGWPGGSADLRGDILSDYRRLESDVAGIDVRWTGSLSLVSGLGQLGGDVPDVGPDQYLVEASRIAELEPRLREPGWAIHTPTDAGVDPSQVTMALVAAARTYGADVVVDSTVTSVDRARGRVVGVTSTAGRHLADTVVLAAGTSVPALCAPLDVHVPVAASPALLLHARAPTGMVKTVVRTADFEVREIRDGHVVMTAPIMDGTATAALDRSARRAVDRFASRFEGGERVRLLRHRLGFRPMPIDSAPVIGRPTAVPGLYLAVMHSALCLAPTVGRLVADDVIGQRPVGQLARCQPDRFMDR